MAWTYWLIGFAAFAGIALLAALVRAAGVHAATPPVYTVDLPIVMNRAPFNSSPVPTATAPPGATPTPTATESPPGFVQSVSPAPGATGVSVAPAITIVFNTTMNQASVQSNTTIAPALYGWSASWQGNTVTFRPALPLDPNTTYTVTLGTGVTTASLGQAAGLPYTWDFTTGPAVAPAQPIAFSHVDTSVGASDLAVMNVDGSGQIQLSQMPSGVLTGDPAWKPGGAALAFDSTFGAATSTLDANVFVANPDGSGARIITGSSFLGQKPGPTGAVQVTVQAPNLNPNCGPVAPGPGPFTITAEGTTNVVTNALPGGAYLLTNVPAGTEWVRVVGYYGQLPSGPGEVQGTATVNVIAGQTTNVTIQLQVGQVFAEVPTWSPDGAKLAYLLAAIAPVCAYNSTLGQYQWQSGGAATSIHVVAPNGTGDIDVFDGPTASPPLTPADLSWSPDGTAIAFGDPQNGIYAINPNGPASQQPRLLIGGPAASYQCGLNFQYCIWDNPRWSPDGTRLAYTEIVVNSNLSSADTLNVLTLTQNTVQTLVDFAAGQYPGVSTWSPASDQLEFQVRNGGLSPSLSDSYDIYLIGANGSGLTRITTGGVSSAPAWRR